MAGPMGQKAATVHTARVDGSRGSLVGGGSRSVPSSPGEAPAEDCQPKDVLIQIVAHTDLIWL